jgi:hypothetical protein
MRRRERAIRKATKESALSANTALTSSPTIAIPANAGPTKRAALNTMLLIATAVASSGLGTRFGISASRAGWLKPITAPWNSTSASRSGTVIAPLAVSTNSASAWSMIRVWATLITRSRSARSASAPPNGPISTPGNRSANATSPSTAPEWLSSQASQPTPIRCIQVPISEMPLPAT